MAISKDKKQEIIQELQSGIAEAGSAVFVNFHGLTVKEVDTLRSALYNEGIRYKVAKKTLLKRALQNAKIPGNIPVMEGEIAIAWSKDLIAPAREVQKFHKTFAGKINIVGGVFEGSLIDQAMMMNIATIPDMQVLRGMFVNVINSPIQGMVIALNALAEKKSL